MTDRIRHPITNSKAIDAESRETGRACFREVSMVWAAIGFGVRLLGEVAPKLIESVGAKIAEKGAGKFLLEHGTKMGAHMGAEKAAMHFARRSHAARELTHFRG